MFAGGGTTKKSWISYQILKRKLRKVKEADTKGIKQTRAGMCLSSASLAFLFERQPETEIPSTASFSKRCQHWAAESDWSWTSSTQLRSPVFVAGSLALLQLLPAPSQHAHQTEAVIRSGERTQPSTQMQHVGVGTASPKAWPYAPL